MKLLLATAIMVLASIFLYPSNAMTTQCSQFTNEQGCENAGCSWCDRCSGKEINNWGSDRCVDNNLQCTYSCSKTCGGNCTGNADCKVNLTDTTCFYAGLCSACSCGYRSADCPQNGTVREQYGSQVCYFGARYCTSGGCSVNSCALQTGQICDPQDGCVSCDDDCIGDEYVIDKRCVGGNIMAKQITYACLGGQCNSTRTDVLVESCKAGCSTIGSPKCNDEICNIAGSRVNCNQYDGFYGDTYCKGNDVYKGYRDYGCGPNECNYINIETKLESCKECQNGRCYDSGVVVNVSRLGDQPSPSPNLPVPGQPNLTLPTSMAGGRLYNGVLFGSNDIKLNTQKDAGGVIRPGKTGEISFKVTRTNGLGTLIIEESGNQVFRTKNAGEYRVSFSGNLRMYTTGSGWLFFVPAVFDIGTIAVSYD